MTGVQTCALPILQIQEMLRTERITSEAAIAHEIATYNELVPGKDELSFTLFVEIADAARRERALTTLVGLDRCVALEIDGEAFAATEKEPPGARPDRTTAVHYMKVPLSAEAASKVRSGRAKNAAVVVSHPDYTARGELGPAALRALAEDLTEP